MYYFAINTPCWTEINSFLHTNLKHPFLSLFCWVIVPFEYCPAPRDIQNVHLWKLLGESQTPPKIIWEVNYQWHWRTTMVSPVLLQQDFIKTSTCSNMQQQLRRAASYPVRLLEFCYATSSAGDSSQEGILTGQQCIIIKSEQTYANLTRTPNFELCGWFEYFTFSLKKKKNFGRAFQKYLNLFFAVI